MVFCVANSGLVMRRKDREIVDVGEKLKIIDENKVCRLALSDNDRPYIVPLNYGYSFENDTLTLYFHGAKEGRKMDIIQKNPSACFEIDCEGGLIEGSAPCNYSYAYKSVIGFGRMTVADAPDEKKDGLTKIMAHQTGNQGPYHFNEKMLEQVVVYKMTVDEFTGKART
jgi:nitroimidazol reductase NimA-like FMN-containing flavoprotein (pyridoxamine 5'-phosphate oxidase superfamily)